MKSWGWLDLNQRIRKESDLQSDAIDRYATPPKECWRKDLNPQPFDYKSNALPIELPRNQPRFRIAQVDIIQEPKFSARGNFNFFSN